LGLRRIIFLIVIITGCMFAFAIFNGYHVSIANSMVVLGIKPINSFWGSIIFSVIFPLFLFIIIGLKIFNHIGIIDFTDYDSDSSYIMDRIFGSFVFLLFFIIFCVITHKY